MIISFADEETEDIYNGKRSKKAMRRLPQVLWGIAYRKLAIIKAASRLDDIRVPPSNHLEVLHGNLKGMHSIRINNQYRVIFKWLGESAEAVKIIDYH
ncbi:MAG: plasmid maintenance system killer protein [Chlamydiia bacterium]|nr:plasmid maintenance system killer protein [Chlamydiia bacterium]